jgi:hypothetical protein
MKKSSLSIEFDRYYISDCNAQMFTQITRDEFNTYRETHSKSAPKNDRSVAVTIVQYEHDIDVSALPNLDDRITNRDFANNRINDIL